MARIEAPAMYAKAAGNSDSPRPVVTAPALDSTQAQPTVVEETAERALPPDHVAEGGAQQPALRLDLDALGLGPTEERLDQGTTVLVAKLLAPGGRKSTS